MYYFFGELNRDIYHISNKMPTYVPILRDDISDSEFISTCTRHLTCYVTQIPNTYVLISKKFRNFLFIQ